RTLGILYKNQEYKSNLKQVSTERKWLSELLKYIPLEDFVQMCMHHSITDWLPFRWNGFRQTTRYTYIINFERKEINSIWNNMEPENRRIIRRATENDLRVEITDDFDLIYKYESLTYERQGLKFRLPYKELKLLDNAIKQRGNRVIFKAVDTDNQVHAVLYIAFNHKSAYALLSGSDADLRKLGGHTFVMWEAIKYFSNKVEYFNFGGSDIERIEAHIRGFGGTLTPYFHIYNEKLMSERSDIWYHLNEIPFHLKTILKKVINKISRSLKLT
ncbi:MAG: GNAT family N-acetyltransferase, partial [Bacteroidetes bacterium]